MEARFRSEHRVQIKPSRFIVFQVLMHASIDSVLPGFTGVRPWSEKMVRKYLARSSTVAFAVRDSLNPKSGIVGVCGISIGSREVSVDRLWVEGSYRFLGVGGLLMRKAEQTAIQVSTPICFMVPDSCDDIHRFLKSRVLPGSSGRYECVSFHKDYFRAGRGLDARDGYKFAIVDPSSRVTQRPERGDCDE